MEIPGRSGRLRAQRWALAAILALETAAGIPIGFWLFFGRFKAYDDESTFMLWDRFLLQGFALYDDVWSHFGPSSFLFRWLLHGLAGAPVSHDVVRLSALALWLAIALLVALAVYRITRQPLPAALAHPLALLQLRPLADEPGHPQGLVALLTAAAAVLAASLAGPRPLAAAAAAGSLAAALLLTKPNAGGFLAVALALALGLAARGGRARRGLRLAAAAGALALPLALMRFDALSGPWSGVARGYWLAVALLAALWLRPPRPPLFDARAALAALAAFAATALALVALAMGVFGSSPRALLSGTFLLPTRIAQRLAMLGTLEAPGSLALLASLALWGLAAARGPRRAGAGEPLPSLALAAAQIVYGAVVCGLVLALSAKRTTSLLAAVSAPFLWLILARGDPRPEASFPRLLLGLVAAAQSLVVYPIAGNQAAIGAVLAVPCALVCLHDGLGALAPRLPGALGARAPTRALAGLALLAPVAIYATHAARARSVYRAQVPLRLPGAEHLRLPEPSVALYRFLSANLVRHCDTYLASPELIAPYFWTGLPAPGRIHMSGGWLWPLLDPTEQERIHDELESFPRACALFDVKRTALSLSVVGDRRTELPLLRFLDLAFDPVAAAPDSNAIGEWEFRVRRGRRLGPEELEYAAVPVAPGSPGEGSEPRSDRHELQLHLPAFPGERATRLAVVDLSRSAWIADTHPRAPSRLRAFAEGRQVLGGADPSPLDLSRARRLRLRWRAEPEEDVAAPGYRIVRVYGGSGELLAPVPVVRPIADATRPTD